MKLKPIKDQVVVVLGASSGIGREVALRFAQRGARVVVAARSEPGLVGWPVTFCLILAYFLAWRWTKSQQLLRLEDAVPSHWTERDHAAWALVEARAKDVVNLNTDQLIDFPFFVQTAEAMAMDRSLR